jgi:hypothetical protein
MPSYLEEPKGAYYVWPAPVDDAEKSSLMLKDFHVDNETVMMARPRAFTLRRPEGMSPASIRPQEGGPVGAMDISRPSTRLPGRIKSASNF